MATTENEFPCAAQRHMDIEFFAYNSMLATAKAGQKKRIAEGKPPGALIFSGALFKLANKINRSKEQASKAVERLERVGWLVLIQDHRRNNRGGWSTVEYRVVEHEEFARTNDCPPEKYIKVKGDRWALAKPGKAAPGLRRANARRLLPHDLPDAWLDMLADALEAKKAERNPTDTGNPVPEQAAVPPPTQEILCPPTQEILSRADTGNPVPTDTGNPVIRFALGSASLLSAPPTCPPTENETGGQAGDDQDFPLDEKTNTTADSEQRWKRFIDATEGNLPEELQRATPLPEGKRVVLAQLDECGGDMYAARSLTSRIDDWAENRKPKLETLNSFVWGDGPDRPNKQRVGWLKECTPGMIAEVKSDAAYDRKKWGAAGFPHGKPNFQI
jgi:hypothetical protein